MTEKETFEAEVSAKFKELLDETTATFDYDTGLDRVKSQLTAAVGMEMTPHPWGRAFFNRTMTSEDLQNASDKVIHICRPVALASLIEVEHFCKRQQDDAKGREDKTDEKFWEGVRVEALCSTVGHSGYVVEAPEGKSFSKFLDGKDGKDGKFTEDKSDHLKQGTCIRCRVEGSV